MKVRTYLASFCTLTTLLPAAAEQTECLASRPNGLCVVDIEKHEFHPVNRAITAELRGVFWIDAGHTGSTNPWVDLNFLTPFPKGDKKFGSYWVRDSTPRYQSWEDVTGSFSYVGNIKKFGSRSEASPDLTINWSVCAFTCGTSYETWFAVPGFASPSKKLRENVYTRSATLFGFTLKTWNAYRIIDEEGKRTEFFEKMVKTMKNGQALMLPAANTSENQIFM